MSTVRSVQVKIVDFGSAQRVSKLGTIVDKIGETEYAGRYRFSTVALLLHLLILDPVPDLDQLIVNPVRYQVVNITIMRERK